MRFPYHVIGNSELRNGPVKKSCISDSAQNNRKKKKMFQIISLHRQFLTRRLRNKRSLLVLNILACSSFLGYKKEMMSGKTSHRSFDFTITDS